MDSLNLGQLTINKSYEWSDGVEVEIHNYGNDVANIPFDELIILRNYINDIIKERGLE